MDDRDRADRAILEEMKASFGNSPTIVEGLAELEDIWELVRQAGYGIDRIKIDPSVVRGLEYYTGPVFEAELLFEIPNEKGQPVVFGSVGGGGRYDGLVGRFMKDDVPATGFSIGVSRLQAALTALGKIDAADVAGPVVVTVMDRLRLADYQRMVTTLRNAGIAAELYLGASGMRAQLKYADRRNAPAVVIQGEDERARGVVQVKDLALGKRLAAGVSGHEQWKEERPGQVEVAEDGLVAAIRAILDA
jgi:histidyl-tRNA synthetase